MTTAKLIRGRSKNSHLLLAGRHVHVFVWLPSWGSRSFGSTLRFRHRDGWTHYRLVLLQRNPTGAQTRRQASGRAGRFYIRGTLTVFEVARWRTSPGTHGRDGMKQYVRLKVSPGGREAPKPKEM